MNDLHWLLDNDAESGYCAKMILLRDEGYTVPKIEELQIITIIILYTINCFPWLVDVDIFLGNSLCLPSK